MYKVIILLVILLTGLTGCTTYLDALQEYQLPMIKAVRARGYCMEKALVLSEECNKKNLPHRIRIGKRYHEDTYTHAWVEVYKGGNRYVLDPAFNWIYLNPTNKYFDIIIKK